MLYFLRFYGQITELIIPKTTCRLILTINWSFRHLQTCTKVHGKGHGPPKQNRKSRVFRTSTYPPIFLCPHLCILPPSLHQSHPSNPSIKTSDASVCGWPNCFAVICNVNMWLRVERCSLWKPLEHTQSHTHTHDIFGEQAAAAWISSDTPTKS